MLNNLLLILLIWEIAFSAMGSEKADTLNYTNSQKIVHLAGHLLLPVGIAYSGYGPNWKSAAKVMIASNLVDADHLLAKPIYDMGRCSIGTHPLHSLPAIGIYSAMTLNQRTQELGIGLLTHMAVDFVDCINTQDRLGTLKFPKYYRDPVNTYSLTTSLFGMELPNFQKLGARKCLPCPLDGNYWNYNFRTNLHRKAI